jgi:hypothetical protein
VEKRRKLERRAGASVVTGSARTGHQEKNARFVFDARAEEIHVVFMEK